MIANSAAIVVDQEAQWRHHAERLLAGGGVDDLALRAAPQ